MKIIETFKQKLIEKILNGKKFTLEECATLPYWWHHYLAVNAIAAMCHVWSFRFLFHDLEKPFLKFLWGDPDRVQEFHVTHANHHPHNKPFEKVNLVEMVVDLDAAFAQFNEANLESINDIVTKTKLKVDVGGGIRIFDDVKRHLDAGVSKVCLGTISVKNKHMTLDMLDEYGFDKIILCPDVNNKFVVTEGWRELSDYSIYDYINYYFNYGHCEYICTDVVKDGMLSGTSLDLYSSILNYGFDQLHLIASGGVSSIKDIAELEKIGVHSVIIGKALFEGNIQIKDLRPWLV